MRLGYNTNGLAHHRLLDAIDLLADEGYESVALTLDAGALDPYEAPPALARQVGLRPRRPGPPGALPRGRDRGPLPPQPEEEARPDPDGPRPLPPRRPGRLPPPRHRPGRPARRPGRLVLVRHRPRRRLRRRGRSIGSSRRSGPSSPTPRREGVRLAFEPEPGMFIDTFARFARLDERIRHPLFDLTVDLGHVHCIEDGPVADHVAGLGPPDRQRPHRGHEARRPRPPDVRRGDHGLPPHPPGPPRRPTTPAACTSSSAATATWPSRPCAARRRSSTHCSRPIDAEPHRGPCRWLVARQLPLSAERVPTRSRSEMPPKLGIPVRSPGRP